MNSFDTGIHRKGTYCCDRFEVTSPSPTLPTHTVIYHTIHDAGTSTWMHHAPSVYISQVRKWGILSHPLETPLGNVPIMMDAVVRLHNFCRRMRAEVPSEGDKCPVASRGNSIIGGLYATEPVKIGRLRAVTGGSTLSLPRDEITNDVAMRGITRPSFNSE